LKYKAWMSKKLKNGIMLVVIDEKYLKGKLAFVGLEKMRKGSLS